MSDNNQDSRGWSLFVTQFTWVLVLAALYLGRDVILPISLAVLLSFVLTPAVKWVERLRVGRTMSVLIVTAVAFSVIAGVSWMATNQVVALSGQLPKYKDNLIAKIRTIRGAASGTFAEAQKTLEDIGDELSKPESSDAPGPELTDFESRWFPWTRPELKSSQGTKEGAVEVRVVGSRQSPLNQIRGWLGPLLSPLATSGVVIVLVIFMLVDREDLRNRMIQLFGTSRLYATTEAIDDATRRLSRYLQMQLLINIIYGLVVAAGLALLGIPNAILWGVLGLLLRFLPYIGPWIAASMPIALSLAISQSWSQPLLTIGLFLAMELIVNNVLEPWLYGSSAGVSSFGVILAAIFWTSLWGPIGLVMAMPLTVCLVVLGKYVPQAAFLSVLLGDRPSIEQHELLYQRLLTSHDMEANRLVEEQLETVGLLDLYDTVLIPALRLAENDRHAGRLSEQQESEVMESARDLIEDLGEKNPRRQDGESPDGQLNIRVLCVPVRDHADETAAMMIAQVLRSLGSEADVCSLELLASEVAARIEERQYDAAVLAVLPPLGSRNGRYLCKRLRKQLPDLRIVVALFEGSHLKKTQQRLLESGANAIAANLRDVAASLRSTSRRSQVVETRLQS